MHGLSDLFVERMSWDRSWRCELVKMLWAELPTTMRSMTVNPPSSTAPHTLRGGQLILENKPSLYDIAAVRYGLLLMYLQSFSSKLCILALFKPESYWPVACRWSQILTSTLQSLISLIPWNISNTVLWRKQDFTKQYCFSFILFFNIFW